MRVGNPAMLRLQLGNIGFVPVSGKSSVFELTLIDKHQRCRLVALVSNKDASLKVYPEKTDPITFRFKQDYDAAADFITAYVDYS
jgi:hypothetical protein